MFDDAKQQMEKILELVQMCPEKLQEKCFEVLMNAYVASLTVKHKSQQSTHSQEGRTSQFEQAENVAKVPEAIKGRLVSTAARLKITVDQLASLFDFNADPFSYHAYAVPGTTKAEKTKNVALLLAAKGYLSGAGWTVDWKEFRASCVDQNCYDKANNGMGASMNNHRDTWGEKCLFLKSG